MLYGNDRGFDAWWSRLADKTARRTRAAEKLRSRRSGIKTREVTR